jgi:hypothetical protein
MSLQLLAEPYTPKSSMCTSYCPSSAALKQTPPMMNFCRVHYQPDVTPPHCCKQRRQLLGMLKAMQLLTITPADSAAVVAA